MNKTKIDYCDSTFNPVTGCLNDCPYCYARGIAERFARKTNENGLSCSSCDKIHDLGIPQLEIVIKNGWEVTRKSPYPFGFTPTFHRYKLNEYKDKKPRTIFVCSMSDLFGEWIPDEWIKEVFKACEESPQHRYLFLTKNPKRYLSFEQLKDIPNNWWIGSTVTGFGEEGFNFGKNSFMSIEPIFSEFINIKQPLKWVIIGAESGRRKDKVVPKREWVDTIVEQCKAANVPVFMKQGERISGNEKDGTAKYFMRELMGESFIQELPWEV